MGNEKTIIDRNDIASRLSGREKIAQRRRLFLTRFLASYIRRRRHLTWSQSPLFGGPIQAVRGNGGRRVYTRPDNIIDGRAQVRAVVDATLTPVFRRVSRARLAGHQVLRARATVNGRHRRPVYVRAS